MHNTALTTTVVGVLRGVIAVVLGFLFDYNVKLSLVNILGISLNTVGGVWYTVAKFSSKQRQKARPSEDDVEKVQLVKEEGKQSTAKHHQVHIQVDTHPRDDQNSVIKTV